MSFIYPNLSDLIAKYCSELQARAVAKMTAARGGIVWWRVGEGKTRIGLFTFASLQNAYQWPLPSVCLVICRRRAFYDWSSEIKLIWPEANIYEDEVPVLPCGSAPVFLLVSHAAVEKHFAALQNNHQIRFVLLDELWLYANHKSKRSSLVRQLTITRRSVGLSGTVMKAKDTLEIYCQTMVVHKNKMLASSPTAFRSAYQKHSLQQLGKEGPTFAKWSNAPGAYHRIMSNLDFAIDVHFPNNKQRKIHEQYHTIPSTKQQRDLWSELNDFYSVDALGLEFNNALAVSIKAQQISNGWVADSSGHIRTVDSNKPEKLRDELGDILAAGERAVVWCAFRHDIALLADYLPFATVQMLGGQEFDVDAWLHGDTHVCLATEASGNSVNHFAQTSFAIYYSANYKWLDMQQSRGRTDRFNSRHSECYYKYLQVAGSLDSHIYHTAMDSGAREQTLIFNAGVSEWFKRTTK